MAKPPLTVAEYLDLVDQAIYEVGELIRCAEDEADPDEYEFTPQLPQFGELERGLKQLHAEVAAGSHAFGNNADLPFMPLVRKLGDRLPFRTLIETINTAHKTGVSS